MHLGILANVERYEVEPEGLDAPQQAAHRKQPRILALVCSKAVSDQADVRFELVDVLVGIDVVIVGRLQALLDES